MVGDPTRLVVLAHAEFPERAKTAVGILRYGSQEVVAVLDREHAGDHVSDHLPDVQDAPIVSSMADAPDCDALVIGIAPIGGALDLAWRSDVTTALDRGCDVIAGLHDFLDDDQEFAALAAEHDCALRDVRKPPDDLGVAEGTAGEVAADVVVTVGTDCSVGKMTTTMAVVEAARERGIDAAVVPTGQTGIMIEGWGIAIDRVATDFAAGAVERMIHRVGDDHDLLVVEGQAAIGHPAYSGLAPAIVHGARPDGLVLCHAAGRESVHGYEETPIPPVDDVAELYESVAAPVVEAPVFAGSLDTHHLDEQAATASVKAYADALAVPATDPIRHGPDPILDAIDDRVR